MLGRKHSEEAKEKMRAFHCNRKNQPVKGFATKVEDIQTGQITIYDSLREAGKGLNSNHKTIKYNLNKNKLFQGRYKITSLKPDSEFKKKTKLL